MPEANGRCTVCSDEATAAVVVAVDHAAHLAAALVGGTLTTVALDLVGHVAEGDVVLVHQGFAISRLDNATEGAR